MKLQTFLPSKKHKQLEAISLLFTHDPSTLDFFLNDDRNGLRFHEDQTMHFFGCYSSGEQILIRIALDIWSYSGNSNLSDILAILDSERTDAFLQAMGLMNSQSPESPSYPF